MSDSKDYIFSYSNTLITADPVTKHYLLLRCTVPETDCQHIIEQSFCAFGFDSLSHGTDSFGNNIVYGGKLASHNSMIWSAQGIVSLSPYCIKNTEDPAVYTVFTRLSAISNEMKSYIRGITTDCCLFDFVLKLNELAHRSISYKPGITTSRTSAQEAFCKGYGVCQDYAHILLSFLRSYDIPCRYVCGFIEGEGSTHAFVEVLIDDFWYAFDPTHNCKVELGYIKLCSGRDAMDCQVCTGVFTGESSQNMSAHVFTGVL